MALGAGGLAGAEAAEVDIPQADAGLTRAVPAAALERAAIYMSVPLPQADLDALAQISEPGSAYDAPAEWLRAEGLFGLGRYVDAAEAYCEYIDANPASGQVAAARLRLAQCDMAAGKWAQALARLSTVGRSALSPAQGVAFAYSKGLCHLAAGNDAAAERDFSEVGTLSRGMNQPAVRHLAGAASYYLGVMKYNSGDYARGAAAMQQLDVTTEPGRRRDVFVAGAALAKGNNEIAASTARRALAVAGLNDSERAAAEHIAGEALWKLDRRDEALPFLQRHVQLAANPAPAALYILGVEEYRAGNNSRAAELLGVVAESDSELAPEASLVRGQALYKLGRREDAAVAFQNAASAATLDEDRQRQAYYNYAVTRFGGASVPFGSASATFEDFLQRYPSGPYTDRVRGFLARGYLAEEDYDRALERLEGMTQPGPEAVAAKRYVLYMLGNRALNNSDASRALNYLDRAAAIPGDRALGNEIQLARGRALLGKGQHEAAAGVLRSYVSSRDASNVPVANYYLGYALLGLQRYDAADAAFDAAGNSQRFSGQALADILNRRADIAYYNHNFGEAATLYGCALNADRASGDYAAFNRARMFGYARNYSAAIEALEAFGRDYPSSALMPDALLEKASAQVAGGRKDDAIATYDALIDRFSGTAQGRQAYIQKAMTLLESGRREEAVDAYKRVVARFPSSAEAEQASGLLRAILADQNRGAEYVAFINSVEGMQAVDRTEAAALEFGTARHKLTASNDTTAMVAFLAQYPDAQEAEEGMALLAQADYDADRTEQALARWQSLEPRASSAAMAMRARMGIMRAARDLGDTALAGATAATILGSSAAPGADLTEATYSRALYLASDSTRIPEAIELWQSVAGRTDELYGAKSAYAAAEALHEQGKQDQALEAARNLASSRSPHKYWIARAFILQADVLAAKNRKTEAREYLRALIENYPGSETDIRVMAQERLDALNNSQNQ